MKTVFICFGILTCQAASFILPAGNTGSASRTNTVATFADADPWQGDVVSNAGGTIRGCTVQQVGDSVTDWIITIDG